MIKSHDFASTYVGTPYYMSPEICAAERYTVKSDIWSLGCIMYELCAREPPFNAKTHYQLVTKIKSGKYTPLPDCYSDELGATIHECLRVNPDDRPTTFNLLQLPIMRLMRKEKEVSDTNSLVKSRETALAAREAKVAEDAAALEASRNYMRQEIDDSLRREWEVKAQLEISKHVNTELENLQRQYEIEVRARVDAELKRRGAAAGAQGKSADREASDSSAPASHSNAASECPEATRRFHGTPMRRVQTMFAGPVGTPGDVEMSEPSPVAISSLSLSPRRNPNAKVPATTPGNIFRANSDRQAGGGDAAWNLARDCHTPDSDDDDVMPSPTRNIKSNKNPFMARNRPALPTSTTKLSSKPLPGIPAPPPASEGQTRSLDAPVSPSRRLTKIPSVANLHRHTEPAPTLSRKPSTVGKKEEPHLGKVAAKNNIRGRTLVELQQARAGGRPLSAVVAPGAENVTPKKGSGTQRPAAGARRVSDSSPAVWDPERDEMPSPFLVRTKPRVRA